MNQSVLSISADDVYHAMNKKKDVVILDVRITEEYDRGHIEGSIHIAVDEIALKMNEMIPDKNKTIYAYCFSGSRSDVAAATLHAMGYAKVFSMANGLLMWKSKHYPLVV